MAQPEFQPPPRDTPTLQPPVSLMAKLGGKWRQVAALCSLWDLKSSVRDWLRTGGEDYLQIIKTGLWDIQRSRRYGYNLGTREAFFTHPKGEEYQFEDDLAHTEETIRLLEILKGKREDVIVCRVHTAPLSEHPSYEALSYCWGSDDPSCPIVIRSGNMTETPADDQEAPQSERIYNLHPNLRSALRRLRFSDRSRYVWADFVCINQTNTKERNHQVALMHKVYSEAKGTLIWLGETHRDCDRAFKALRRVARDDENDQINDTVDALALDESPLNVTSAIIQLIDRPWFYRLWTVQEVLLAKEAEIICGEESMPWEDFARAMSIIHERDLAPGRRMSLLDQGRFESFKVLIRGRQEMSLHEGRNPYERLTNLLLMLRRRQSECPDDKVYGLSGLVRSSDGALIIEPNYHVPYQELYAAVTKLVIENTGQLDILSASGSTSLSAGHGQLASSWIGDFVLGDRRPPWSFRFIHGSGFRTCQSELEANPDDISFDEGQLILKGCFVGEIEKVAAVLHDFDRAKVKERIETGSKDAKEVENLIQLLIGAVHGPDAAVNPKNKLMLKFFEKVGELRVMTILSWATFAANNKELGAMYNWHLQSVQVFLDWERLADLETCATGRLYTDDGDDGHAGSDAGSDADLDSGPGLWSLQRREEYWRTITGGNLLPISSSSSSSSSSLYHGAVPPPSSSPEVKASREAFKRFDEMLAITRRLRRRGISNEEKVGRLFSFICYVVGQCRAPSDFSRLLTHAQGRCLARTVSGDLVLVRDTVQPGDRLAFCRGAKVPLVLRELPGSQNFRYVCESYSHRLQGMPLEGIRWQEIRIA